MSEATFKAVGWQPQGKPAEGKELDASRQLIREVIFSLYREKADILASMGFPSQPVRLSEIYKEIESRVQIKRNCRNWPFPLQEKRWWDRRVNECACPSYASDGVPKVISTSAGYYEPNKALFSPKTAAFGVKSLEVPLK